MSLAPWRPHLSRALHLNRSQPYSRYLQLATVRQDGKPANRTVVFRGFLDNSDRLQMIADSRSEKIAQIDYSPWGEACWYFTKTREQFRLLGKLTLVTVTSSDEKLQKARKIVWQGLSDAARSQFVWAEPGKPRVQDLSAFSSIPSSEEPIANFCLLLLNPEKVDRLELKGNPQNRHFYYLNDSQTWLTQEVNP